MYKIKKKLIKTTVQKSLKISFKGVIRVKKSYAKIIINNEKESSFPLANIKNFKNITGPKKTKICNFLIGGYVELFIGPGPLNKKSYLDKNNKLVTAWQILVPYFFKTTLVAELFLLILEKNKQEHQYYYNHPAGKSTESTSGFYDLTIWFTKQSLTTNSFFFTIIDCMHKDSDTVKKLAQIVKFPAEVKKPYSSIFFEFYGKIFVFPRKTLEFSAKVLASMWIIILQGLNKQLLLKSKTRLFANRNASSISTNFGIISFDAKLNRPSEIFLKLFTIDADVFGYLECFPGTHIKDKISYYCPKNIIVVVPDKDLNCDYFILRFRSKFNSSMANAKSVKFYCFMVNVLLEFRNYLDPYFIWLLLENVKFLHDLEKLEMSEKNEEKRNDKIRVLYLNYTRKIRQYAPYICEEKEEK